MFIYIEIHVYHNVFFMMFLSFVGGLLSVFTFTK